MDPGFHNIKQLLQKQEYPANASSEDKKTLRRLASQFFLNGYVLYKRNHDMVFLRCLDGHDTYMLIKEIHEGSFGTHANEYSMTRKNSQSGILLDDDGNQLFQIRQEVSQVPNICK